MNDDGKLDEAILWNERPEKKSHLRILVLLLFILLIVIFFFE